jgi:hypothetical protein
MPVLAVQTIEGAALIEYGQIMLSELAATWADPVCHAVRREWVAIPVEDAPLRCPGDVA